MPPLPSRPYPDPRAATPARSALTLHPPNPHLFDRLADLLDRLPRRDLLTLREALDAGIVPLLAGAVADAVTLRDAVAVTEGADACVDIAAEWDRFWSRHPNQVDQIQARELFWQLPWTRAGFQQDFREGHDRCLLAAKLNRRRAPSPYWWIKGEGWTERPQGPDGKRVVGDAERTRRAAEARSRPHFITDLAAAAVKSLPPPEPDNRTMAQVALESLLAALDDPASTPELIQQRREFLAYAPGGRALLRGLESKTGATHDADRP